MPIAFKVYLSAWVTACLVALLLMYRESDNIDLLHAPYWAMLLQPWKVTTFVTAALTMTIMAPYTGDPTWDYFDAAFMSIFAFTSAPWVVAILYRIARAKVAPIIAYCAICVWMFSASWSYDGYLVLRDGTYPFTWLPNIFASSVLYFSAGLFWTLEWQAGRGVHFGFTETDWPASVRPSGFGKIFWYALPFMLLVSAMILPFIL